MLGVFVSFVIFATVRTFARPPPRTMTREYQEMTDDYLAVRSPLNPSFPFHLLHRSCNRYSFSNRWLTISSLQNQNTEPISGGIGTGGKYTYVQSKPAGKM